MKHIVQEGAQELDVYTTYWGSNGLLSWTASAEGSDRFAYGATEQEAIEALLEIRRDDIVTPDNPALGQT